MGVLHGGFIAVSGATGTLPALTDGTNTTVNPYHEFLAERVGRLRVATMRDGATFSGRLLLPVANGEAEAWRCPHQHATQGLALLCAFRQCDTLRPASPDRQDGGHMASEA